MGLNMADSCTKCAIESRCNRASPSLRPQLDAHALLLAPTRADGTLIMYMWLRMTRAVIFESLEIALEGHVSSYQSYPAWLHHRPQEALFDQSC